MKNKIISLGVVLILIGLSTAALLSLAGCSSSTAPSLQAAPPSVTPTTSSAPDAVKLVVAGYINHGPMQPTVQAIKDVLAKYGDKVSVSWVDLNTKDGQAYFKQYGLTAHMNVIINGKYQYQVNGKTVTFQWFEGQQWTRQDLDAVIASLVNK